MSIKTIADPQDSAFNIITLSLAQNADGTLNILAETDGMFLHLLKVSPRKDNEILFEALAASFEEYMTDLKERTKNIDVN